MRIHGNSIPGIFLFAVRVEACGAKYVPEKQASIRRFDRRDNFRWVEDHGINQFTHARAIQCLWHIATQRGSLLPSFIRVLTPTPYHVEILAEIATLDDDWTP